MQKKTLLSKISRDFLVIALVNLFAGLACCGIAIAIIFYPKIIEILIIYLLVLAGIGFIGISIKIFQLRRTFNLLRDLLNF